MTKEELIAKELDRYMLEPKHIYHGTDAIPAALYRAMDEYAKPYKEIADLISRIFYYGNFKAETHNERILEQRLRQVGLWPTSEHMILQRPEIKFIEQQNKQ